MTIAACLLSSEGVVLGADSTATMTLESRAAPGGPVVKRWSCHFDYAQKLYRIGEGRGSIGVVSWGLAKMGKKSPRLISAELASAIEKKQPATMKEVAALFAASIWSDYTTACATDLATAAALRAKAQQTPPQISQQEIEVLAGIDRALTFGFCVAGRTLECSPCEAFTIEGSPATGSPVIQQLKEDTAYFWGVPGFFRRLVAGYDENLEKLILDSPHWKGTKAELQAVLGQIRLVQPTNLPVREAIDWVHTVIHTTIRAVKFSNMPHVCGGPVDIAVITVDRPFRWVIHKPMSAALWNSELIDAYQP